MSLENIETGEVVERATEEEARQGTAKLNRTRDRVANGLAEYAEQVKDAYRRRFDLALGYSSWSEYATAELDGDDPLTADIRRQLVGMLSADGMSMRAIAPVAGVSIGTVSGDKRSGVQSLNTSHSSPTSPATPPEPAATVGLDGKTYRRPPIDRETGEVLDIAPEPPKTRRQPLPDAFLHQAITARKAVESLERLVADDRFPRNREEVSAINSGDLTRTIDALQRVVNALTK